MLEFILRDFKLLKKLLISYDKRNIFTKQVEYQNLEQS